MRAYLKSLFDYYAKLADMRVYPGFGLFGL